MKKTLLSFAVCTAVISLYGQTVAPNASFESWDNMAVKDSLDEWFNGTQELQGQGIFDVITTYEIPSAYLGSKAVHLETIEYFNQGTGMTDTAFGYIVKEAADGGGFEGFPYSDTVDLFTCWYKCDIVGGDQGVVIIELYNSGSAYSSTVYPIIGTVSSWTQLNIPLSGGSSQVPDSVFIGVASSDPFNPGVAAPGSWIEVDAFSFDFLAGSTVPSPVPNGSFENWTYETIEVPTDWFSFDEFFYPVFGTQYATKSSTASQGSYSLQIETTFEMLMMGTPCIVTNGDFSVALDSVVGGTPFIAQPAQVSGVYQFTESFVDTAYVFIDFWNATSGLHHMYVDTLLDNSSWTTWSMDLTFTEAPDSMLMYFWGGKNLGSTLLVDAITFSGGDLSAQQMNEEQDFGIYPNPAQNAVTIQADQVEIIRVFDMAGNLILIQNELHNTGTIEISTAEFENGMYLVQIIHEGKIQSQQLIIQH